MLTVKLQDDNFQFQSVLRGYDLFDHFTGEAPCPPRFVIDRKSTSGYVFLLAAGSISWKSSKKTVIASSTMEFRS